LTYTFEVATDTGFNTKVFSRSSVTPGDGKTTVQIDKLEIGRSYYWRAWAADGANTGTTATASFEIYPKPAVTAPVAIAPINNELLTTTTPTIKVTNAQFSGPVGFLAYEFQVASDQAFTKLVAAGIVNEGAGQTSFNSTPLTNGLTMYWRARASDRETTSAWSTVQTFRTPAPPAPAPSPTPTPGTPVPAGSCALPTGPQVIACIQAKYPDKTAPVSSLSQRQANMMFLRDRVIEAGLCAGNTYGWNLKRGGP
jgi:hypothetical protein